MAGPEFVPDCAVYRVAELARLLDMGERQVREAIIRGEIPCHKIGGQVRCSRVAIHRWLDGEEVMPRDLEGTVRGRYLEDQTLAAD